MAKTLKPVMYCILALYRKRKNGSYTYEWKEMRSYGTKKEAIDYAKRESRIAYRDGRTGRYLIRKEVNDSFYEDGKLVD